MTDPKPLVRREVLQTAAALGIGGAALGLGVAAPRVASGKAYETKKAEIAKRFPGLVLVLRKLADDEDLSKHAGKPLSFTD